MSLESEKFDLLETKLGETLKYEHELLVEAITQDDGRLAKAIYHIAMSNTSQGETLRQAFYAYFKNIEAEAQDVLDSYNSPSAKREAHNDRIRAAA